MFIDGWSAFLKIYVNPFPILSPCSICETFRLFNAFFRVLLRIILNADKFKDIALLEFLSRLYILVISPLFLSFSRYTSTAHFSSSCPLHIPYTRKTFKLSEKETINSRHPPDIFEGH